IPYYPWFLIKEMERLGYYDYSHLLKTAREINDEMAYYWVNNILQNALKINKPLNEVKICINGITFRKGVKSTHYSRNMKIAEILRDKGFNVYVFDELYSKKEIEAMGLSYLEPRLADMVFESFTLEIKINPS
ncbi:MAG: nucleotide sugar dehydrogenase, partial [Candidatus Odinarchaeota archaeon]